MGNVVSIGRLSPPSDLDPRHHAEFRAITDQLAELAHHADPATVARLARLRAEERETSALIDAAGRLVKGRDGNTVRHPLLGSLDKIRARITKIESEIGLTAASRRRITGKRPTAIAEAESDTDFLMRLYFSTSEPSAEDMPRLERLAAEGKARTKAAKRRRRRG